jgi:hypothetical protein
LGLTTNITSVDGDALTNVTICRQEPDGVVFKTESGLTKVKFIKMISSDQLFYGFDPVLAQNFSQAQIQSAHERQLQLEALALNQAKTYATPQPVSTTPQNTFAQAPKPITTYQNILVKNRRHNTYEYRPYEYYYSSSSSYEKLRILKRTPDGLEVEGESGNTFILHIEQLPPELKSLYQY